MSKRSIRKTVAVSAFLAGGGALAALSTGTAHADTQETPDPITVNRITEVAEQQLAAPKPGTFYSQGAYQAWCADFVSWVLKEAGTPVSQGNGWRVPSVWGLRNALASEGKVENAAYVPQPGDVVFYGNSHTNVVQRVEGDIIVTIGGNESGTVSLGRQTRYGSGITGYARTGAAFMPAVTRGEALPDPSLDTSAPAPELLPPPVMDAAPPSIPVPPMTEAIPVSAIPELPLPMPASANPEPPLPMPDFQPPTAPEGFAPSPPALDPLPPAPEIIPASGGVPAELPIPEVPVP